MIPAIQTVQQIVVDDETAAMVSEERSYMQSCIDRHDPCVAGLHSQSLSGLFHSICLRWLWACKRASSIRQSVGQAC